MIYFFLHSALATEEVKESLQPLFGNSKRKYRLFYSFISTIGLLLIGFLLMTTPSIYFIEGSGWNRYIGLVLSTWGILLLSSAFKSFSTSQFLGLKEDQSDKELITTGLHGRIRHPLYAATILITLGALIFIPSDIMLVSALMIFLYLPIGIYLEEQKLKKLFGDSYIDYKKKTPAILPRFR